MTEHTWPTREEFEADWRRRAEYAVEDGGCPWPVDWPDGVPHFNAEERAEVETLAPVIVKLIRRECGRVERRLRADHPDIAALARGVHPDEPDNPRWTRQPDYESYERMADRFSAAIDALTGDAAAAYHTLMRLDHLRRRLSKDRYYSPFDYPDDRYPWQPWPQGYEEPSSPELDRLYAITDAAIRRDQDKWRAEGRRMLDDLDSGAAWQTELERRADVDEYLRNGPAIHRVMA